MTDGFMIIVKYLLLGLIQGVTEPIPISSSGHLVIVEALHGLKIEVLIFEVFVNFASLMAVLIVFREDIARIGRHTARYVLTRDKKSRSEFWFAVYIVIGTITAAVLGILFEDLIEGAV